MGSSKLTHNSKTSIKAGKKINEGHNSPHRVYESDKIKELGAIFFQGGGVFIIWISIKVLVKFELS